MNVEQEKIRKARQSVGRTPELEAVAKTFEAPPPAPPRKANRDNLACLVRRLEKVDKLQAETEALRPKLEAEINATLENGDVADEKLSAGLATKRGQLELVPFKLKQIEREREKLTVELLAEFQACQLEFSKQFDHVHALLHQHVDAFLRPLMAEDAMVEWTITNFIVPNMKLNRAPIGLLNRLQCYVNSRNYPMAARELLNAEKAATDILAEAEKLSGSKSKK
jgi:hypothetical protein